MTKANNTNNTDKGNVSTVTVEKPVKAGKALLTANEAKAMAKAKQNKPISLHFQKQLASVASLPIVKKSPQVNEFTHKIPSKSQAIDDCLMALAKGQLTVDSQVVINYLKNSTSAFSKCSTQKAMVKKISDHCKYYAGTDAYNFKGKLAKYGYDAETVTTISEVMTAAGESLANWLAKK